MKKNKILSSITSTILVTSMLLTGCGGNETNASTAASQTPTASEPSVASEATGAEESKLLPVLSADEQGKPGALTLPRSNYVAYPYEDAEDIKLTYWLPVPSSVQQNPKTTDSVQMTQWAQLWQEMTGIEVEFIGPTSDTATAFNLMTTSTELPDIIQWEWVGSYSGGPSAAEDEGVLIYLDEFITPDGPAADLWQYLQDNPTLDQMVKTDDGHYYAFPMVRGSKYLNTTSGPIVRKDLIEAVGYKVEDMVTIDDWTEVMTALKEYGIEKPLTASNFDNLATLTLGAYQTRLNMYVDYETGAMTYGRIEEGYKEWLKQMVAWLDAGLLDADILTNNNSARQANMLTSKEVSEKPISAITYGAGGGQIGTWNTAAWSQPDVYGEDYELTGVLFPVLNEDDEVRYGGGGLEYATNAYANAVITADCEYPEVAAAFLNFCYSMAGHDVINFGIEGTDYTQNADGTITYSENIMKNPEGLSVAAAMSEKGRANQVGPFVQDPNYIIGYWATEQQQRALHAWNDESDAQATLTPAITLTADEASEYSKIMADIGIAVKEYYSKVFAGEMDVDSTWDAYVDQLKGMGIESAIAIQQAALERYNAR